MIRTQVWDEDELPELPRKTSASEQPGLPGKQKHSGSQNEIKILLTKEINEIAVESCHKHWERKDVACIFIKVKGQWLVSQNTRS
jgi:hypothetical protein